MRRGGAKLSEFFNRFCPFFPLFRTFFQIFRNFSHFLALFKHELARLVLPHFARFAYLNSPSERNVIPGCCNLAKNRGPNPSTLNSFYRKDLTRMMDGFLNGKLIFLSESRGGDFE